MFPHQRNPKKSGDSHSPTKSSQPKQVSFELLVPQSPQHRARLPMRVNIFPADTTDSIIKTVKTFYGLYEHRGVVFEDASQNTLIPAYENFVHGMVVYLRVTTEESDVGEVPPSPHQSTPLYHARRDDASRMPPLVLNRLHHTLGGQNSSLRPGRHRDPSPTGIRTRSTAESRSVGSHGRFVDSNVKVKSDSDSDGNEASVTGSQFSRKDHIASAEISVDNIVEGGRRKRAKFESSKLPLFMPPQVPPFSFDNPQRFAQPYPLPSPHIHRDGAPSPPQESSRQGQGYSSRSRAPAPYFLFGLSKIGGAALPTPDPTFSNSVIDDEDVARQLMRLGDSSNFSNVGAALTSTDSGYGSYAKSRISQSLQDSSRFSTNSIARKASSKADVFEQKVASAVDEANSSDSDATFIYESNPPDQQPRRRREHHHSRTPTIGRALAYTDKKSRISQPLKALPEDDITSTYTDEPNLVALPEDDKASTYTDESDLSSTIKALYAGEFARLLFEGLGAEGLDSESIDKIHSGLEQSLISFALRLGHSAKSIEMLNSMVFIHRYRRNIIEAFRDVCPVDGNSLLLFPRSDNEMSFNEKFINWDLRGADDIDRPPGSTDINDADAIEGEGEEEGKEEKPPELSAFRKSITESGAYSWLLSQLRCKILLSTPEPNIGAKIRDVLFAALPSPQRISRLRSPETFQASFALDWEPLAFLDEQQYKGERDHVFETAITLTGSVKDSQAVTCGDYLKQTWPLIGEYTLRVLKCVVQSGPSVRNTSIAPDGTHITAWIHFHKVMVEVLGMRDSIAEVGEQLAWLGSAMRSSPTANGPVYCCAQAQVDRVQLKRPGKGVESDPSRKIYCSINFKIEQPEARSRKGRCWYGLFRNPVIARGFPIPYRAENKTGIEIPLHIMAGLAQARRATTFNGILCIKGFSTMLVPTRKVGKMTLWHLLYNENRTRLSYLDRRIHKLQDFSVKDISIGDLGGSKHVLGWSSSVQVYAGASDGKYDVQRSGFPSNMIGYTFGMMPISTGRIITTEAIFSVGIKDIPLHLKRDGSYVDQIEDAYNNYVNLYDADNRRAWLVNGATALLHIVRASLEDSRKGKFSSQSLFKPEDLKEAPVHHTSESAIDVLISRANMELKIAHDKDEIWTEVTENKDRTVQAVKRKQKFILFQDLVEQKWHILEQMLDQSRFDALGARREIPGRQYLEGYDFVDIATRVHDLQPKVTTLQSSGKGWVDFARSIGSITLFGRGFGEVMRPGKNSNELCQYWKEVPKGMDYLIVSYADLEEISKRNGNPLSSPRRLMDNICWHKPDRLFEPCKCKPNSRKKRLSTSSIPCDRVQVLLPQSTRFRGIASPGDLDSKSKGAVIFGHSRAFPLRWGEFGDPEEGEPTPPREGLESQTNDSGLGSSIGLSGTEEIIPYKRRKR